MHEEIASPSIVETRCVAKPNPPRYATIIKWSHAEATREFEFEQANNAGVVPKRRQIRPIKCDSPYPRT